MIDAHGKLCRDCCPLGRQRARYCDEGWGLAQMLAGTKDDIRRLTPADLGPAPTLF